MAAEIFDSSEFSMFDDFIQEKTKRSNIREVSEKIMLENCSGIKGPRYKHTEDRRIFIAPGDQLAFSVENCTDQTVLQFQLSNEDDEFKDQDLQCTVCEYEKGRWFKCREVPSNKETRFYVTWRKEKPVSVKYLPHTATQRASAEVTFPAAGDAPATYSVGLVFQCVNSCKTQRHQQVPGNKLLQVFLNNRPTLDYRLRVCKAPGRDHRKYLETVKRQLEGASPDQKRMPGGLSSDLKRKLEAVSPDLKRIKTDTANVLPVALVTISISEEGEPSVYGDHEDKTGEPVVGNPLYVRGIRDEDFQLVKNLIERFGGDVQRFH